MSENKGGMPTKVVIGTKEKPVRFSYAHVWAPAGMNGGEPKYSVSIIIDKDDTVSLNAIKSAIEAARELGKAKTFGGKIPANLKQPLRDGDAERPDDPTYKGKMFMTASTKAKPGIVGKDAKPIVNESDFYSGCYGRASLNFFPFNSNGSKGVACGLNHLQKLADGEALGGRGRAEDDFEAIEDDEDLLG